MTLMFSSKYYKGCVPTSVAQLDARPTDGH